jgi:hypothetical protein
MAAHAIVSQLERLTAFKGMTPESAMAYLMERTVAYSEAIKGVSKEDFRFIPESQNWFSAGSYEVEESLWAIVPKNGETNGSTKLQRNLARLAALDKV